MSKRPRASRSEHHGSAPASPEAPAPLLDWRLSAAVAAVLVIAVFAIYGQCASHRFIQYDDPAFVVQNEHVNTGLTLENVRWAFTTVHSSNWIPLTWLSFMTDVELFGLDAGRMVLVNTALHALNAVLLFLFFRRATKRFWPSAVVAALFAVHPLHVESVAWVTERKDVLSTLFFLLALLAWLGWARTASKASYGAALAALAAGLMAKPMLVTAPFVLILLDYWPLQRRIDWRTLREKLPFFAVVAAVSAATLRTQEGARLAVSLGQRVGNAIVSWVAYVGEAVWPARLGIFYPFPRELSMTAVASAFVLLAAITIAAFALRKRFPYLIVGWLWYAGTLVPVIGLVHVGLQARADRYSYIPLIGIFFAAVWLLADVVPDRRVLAVVAALALGAFGTAAWAQAAWWQDGVTLFRRTIAVTRDNTRVHGLLAWEYMDRQRWSEAASEFRLAVATPEREDSMLRVGLGSALLHLGDTRGAVAEFQRAVAINPRNADALRELGNAAMSAGRRDEAISLLERSLAAQHDPRTVAALLAARGNPAGAVDAYRQAVAADPADAGTHNDLAAALAESGRDAEALAEYQEALRLDPGQYDARMNVGALLSRLGRDAEALESFRAAAASRPRSPEPRVYLALAYSQANRFGEAIREAEAAREIDAAGANQLFTSAVHIPFKESNLSDWIALLRRQKR